MNRRKVLKFKNQQERLAKQISQELNIPNFLVYYEQQIPSAYIDKSTGKLFIQNPSQCIFPTASVRIGRNKMIVVMYFYGSFHKRKTRKIGKILKRNFKITFTSTGFEIRSSFNQDTIAKN